MSSKKEMIEKRSWAEFHNAGLLWWVNRALHLFGWALVAETDKGEITNVYPACCRFRGFSAEVEDDGFKKLTNHLSERWPEIEEDVEVLP